MTNIAADSLSWYEIPRSLIEPMLRFLRFGNTIFDSLFYDVQATQIELLWRGSIVVADVAEATPSGAATSGKTFSVLDLSALSNPEGVILIVDAAAKHGPYVSRPFATVKDFLADPAGKAVRALSVTGVGSSALGSVAFAWNLSAALGEPVAAIVPGYGVADVVEQGLGGWFGFGLHGWWVKEVTQQFLARAAPRTAEIGRGLMMTVPHEKDPHTGAPVFQRGNGSSDVLHAILKDTAQIERLYGHSKGALVIENAIADLPKERTAALQIVTFGCAIDGTTPARDYRQILGVIDGLGFLNSWGSWARMPIVLTPSHHSTNGWIALSMPVARLARSSMTLPALRNAPHRY
jgi:hypothetical protein